jgi:arginase
VQISEPAFPEAQRGTNKAENIGLLNGAIADAVAAARQQGAAVLLVGGNCSHMTGVVGGLQDAHGAGARIGLVWFDAHGDFNTPRTTLSGMYGGMPVAVAVGLAYPGWRTRSHIAAPLPTDRIVLVDVRNLDLPEAQLIRATDTAIAAVASGRLGDDLSQALNDLAARCDLLYLHIDSDILDEAYVPNHNTKEPYGPNMAQVQAAIELVMATGKVAALAVVSVNADGAGAEIALASGVALIGTGLAGWQRYGMV